MLFFPSVEVGNISLVMPDLELLTVAWSFTKGWSISWAAVGRAAGSRCKQSFRKLFASEERLSGISGMSLLFPILNIAATCEIHPRLADNQWKNWHHIIDKHVKVIVPIQSITHPFILTPRRLCCCHLKNGAAKAPNVYWKAVTIAIHNNLNFDMKRENSSL